MMQYRQVLRSLRSILSDTPVTLQRTRHLAVQADSKASTKQSSNGNSAGIPRSKYELFARLDVQDLLRSLSSVDPHKTLPNLTHFNVAREVTLMTEKQLEKAQKVALEKANEMAQMPPVLPEREECERVMSVDSQLAGFSTCSYVFTDITLGVPERKRTVVVRSPDGTLKSASWDIRDRILQVYYPRRGRRITPAPMFSGHYLQKLISEQRYRYLLDSACCQFEPDHPQFVQVTQMVYEDCDVNATYDDLLSTRHYGPMIFHFVLHKRISSLFKHLIRHARPDDCIEVIKLYSIVWDVELSPPASDSLMKEKLNFIKRFLRDEELSTPELESGMDTLLMKHQAASDLSQTQATEGRHMEDSASASSDIGHSDSVVKSTADNSEGDSSDSDSSDSGSDSDSSDSDEDKKK